MTYIKSNIDNNFYLVRDNIDKQRAANILAKMRQNVIKLSDYLYNNIENSSNKEYKEYIIRLHDRINDIVIVESTQDSIYTSFSVNKGEQIVFCLRSKKDINNLHDINLMMYVILHEISHVACPIYDNHGPLFKKIFAFITSNAINIGIYNKINFDQNNEEYCGLMITNSIV
jgi:beta-galactosidase beta subunit